MEETRIDNESVRADSENKTNSQTPGTNGGTPPADTDHSAFPNQILRDAERLLEYAAQKGIDIEPIIRDPILQARAASSNGWSAGMTHAFNTVLAGQSVGISKAASSP
jgi:hypothetical protein